MSYTLDTSHRAIAFRKGRQGTLITTIVVHWWGDPATDPLFDATVGYFERGGNNTSAHYVVESGRVANMVDDADTAYHAGNWSMNLKSIGIECNPRATDADKATVAELILDLEKKHGLLHIIGHRDVISTECPGAYYPPINTLTPWLYSNIQPPVQENETMMPIFMASTGESDPATGKPWTPIYAIVPNAPLHHITPQEWDYWVRLGAQVSTDRFFKQEIQMVWAQMQPGNPTAP